MLILPIKKQWLDMIASGEKKEEYRAITPRYTTMFKNALNERGEIVCLLRNGYSSDRPSIKITAKLSIGPGKPEWGASPNTDYFVLSILKKE